MNGLRMELLSGAFMFRKHRFYLENFQWWMKLNLAFGALFPSAAGEIYWALRDSASSGHPAANERQCYKPT